MFNIFLAGQENLFVLISAFIIGGIFKSNSLFLPIFIGLTQKIKSKRLGLLVVSFISGVLPIEGRVSISAPILDSLIRKGSWSLEDAMSFEKKRAKLGILDYVANHHYYLWSPIEKSIILLMAGLGLTYGQVLAYTAIPLALYFYFLIVIVFFYIQEDDICYETMIPTPWNKYSLLNIVPFIAGIGFSIAYPPYYVFPIVALYYVIKNKATVKECISFINWKALFTVAFIIIFSNLVKANNEIVTQSLNDIFAFSGEQYLVTALAIIAGGITAFVLGSSSKYAGICVTLTLVLGMKYFPLILMVEYSAYLLSPTHKCLAISSTYFKTNITEFYMYVGELAGMLIFCGFAMMLFL